MKRLILLLMASCALAQPPLKRDVPFFPTKFPLVEAMLDLAEVGASDIVYDLGSGDGRIVIGAARRGARGVGVELDPVLVKLSLQNAREAGVTALTEFRQGDLFQADVREATVVAIYLLPTINARLRPKLERELAPGTRVVSHAFPVEGWTPEKTVMVGKEKLLLYSVKAP
jgi:hypothetical protein